MIDHKLTLWILVLALCLVSFVSITDHRRKSAKIEKIRDNYSRLSASLIESSASLARLAEENGQLAEQVVMYRLLASELTLIVKEEIGIDLNAIPDVTRYQYRDLVEEPRDDR